MSKRKINIKGLTISIKEGDFVSLTDIARRSDKPAYVVRKWLQNQKTLLFLDTWEQVHNPDFKVTQMGHFKMEAVKESFSVTPQKYIQLTNAVGLKSSSGRYGGTFAHADIALHFCFWYDPEFQVYFVKEFQRLKQEEAMRIDKTSEWHVRLITDRIDDVRNLLDTIPHQNPERNRFLGTLEEEE